MKRSGILILFLLWIGLFVTTAPVSGEPLLEEEKEGGPDVERLFMGGTEIQGTIEKPHVVYIVPWKEGGEGMEREIPFERSFREEILTPVDFARFQGKWGSAPEAREGGEKR